MAIENLTPAQLRRAVHLRRVLVWHEAREACEKSLLTFLREAWPQIDSSPFTSNWHIEAICEHLEAVTNGDIKRLVINVPPRSGKTNIISIAWPVWTWILEIDPNFPLRGAGVRFLCASYGATKAEGDGVTARRLIGSTWFQERWGDRVKISRDRDNQAQFDTTAGGSRISTGIPESLGKGGAIRICFPYEQIIQTEFGAMRIGYIVEHRLPLCVPSLDEQSGKIELQPIIGWHRNPGSEIVRLSFDNGAIIDCTPDHKFLMADGEWLAAAAIPLGAYAKAADCRQVTGDVVPVSTTPDFPDAPFADAEATSQRSERVIGEINSDHIIVLELCLPVPFSALVLPTARERPVVASISPVLLSSAVAQVTEPRVCRVPVQMTDFMIGRARTNERPHDQTMHPKIGTFPTSAQGDKRITTAVQPRVEQLPLTATTNTASVDSDSIETAYTAPIRNYVVGPSRDRAPLLSRLVSREVVDHAEATYCITVEQNRNMICGYGNSMVFAKNCDDPHKTDEVESALVREGVTRAYNEVWRSRSNDPVNGAEVIVMQRLHEADLSGHVLNEPGIVHLCLPMEYDPGRHCHTVLGFDDPRKVAGELLWPDRFDASWVTHQKRLMGPHAWTGQMQQSPHVRGGGIIQRDWWKVWPPTDQEDSWQKTILMEDGRSVTRMLYPDLDYVLVSVDTAYTAKEENDWSACTVWGSFEMSGNPKIILLEAWRERLELRALVMKILETARRRKADGVLVEAKAAGLSVMQEMRRLMRDGEFTIFADVPKGDKSARLHAVSAAFSDGLIFAPDRSWAEMVIDEVESFPRGRYDDLCDTVSAGIKKMREIGLVQHVGEFEAERLDAITFRGNQPTVREEYGV